MAAPELHPMNFDDFFQAATGHRGPFDYQRRLIGTRDMLLSRALNRGYGMSRYRWPMHFGLLNNDCLWVMDETQLMGAGLATACQLEAFRAAAPEGFQGYGGAGSVTWYMSATTNPNHLKTREWRGVRRPREFEFGLSDEEKAATSGELHKRRFAAKQLELRENWSFEDATAGKSLVEELRKQHEAMLHAIRANSNLPTRTLIICNTVDRAKEVHMLLASEKPDGCDLLLLHSRFRPPERRAHMERLARFPHRRCGNCLGRSPPPLPAHKVREPSWTHLAELVRLDDPWQRAFYENECLKANWSKLQLQRQIGALLHEWTTALWLQNHPRTENDRHA